MSSGMTNCPDCGHENLPGADECDECGQSLSTVDRPPATQIGQDISEDRIERLRPRKAVSVAPTTQVGQVLRLLVDHRIGCVIVEDEGGMVGIFTERDALFRLNADAARLAHRPVAEFMTPNPETLKASDTIAFALQRMDVGGFRHIPIVDGKRAVGIISIRDILRYLAERLVAA